MFYVPLKPIASIANCIYAVGIKGEVLNGIHCEGS